MINHDISHNLTKNERESIEQSVLSSEVRSEGSERGDVSAPKQQRVTVAEKHHTPNEFHSTKDNIDYLVSIT